MQYKYFSEIISGVAEELVRDNQMTIPSSMTGWSNGQVEELKDFGPIRYMTRFNAAMQIFQSSKTWTMGYLPIQLSKVMRYVPFRWCNFVSTESFSGISTMFRIIVKIQVVWSKKMRTAYQIKD